VTSLHGVSSSRIAADHRLRRLRDPGISIARTPNAPSTDRYRLCRNSQPKFRRAHQISGALATTGSGSAGATRSPSIGGACTQPSPSLSLEDTSPPWSADATHPECGHCWRHPKDSEPSGRLCAKIGLFQSSRSVFVQASTSARKPILVESRTMRSAASGGVSKARTSKIAPT
jgi:hypothetical protein